MFRTIFALFALGAFGFAYSCQLIDHRKVLRKMTDKADKAITSQQELETEQEPEPEPEPEPELSEKTKQALDKARAEKDKKTENWILTSIKKGYEGAGVIFYLKQTRYEPVEKMFVLGINKENKAEYPGGKCEEEDNDIESTAAREVLEETGLIIDRSRFVNGLKVTGGTTGYPSYVFLVEITMNEFLSLIASTSCSPDNTFIGFITVDNILDTEKVLDSVSKTEYELRKFNRKYVIPQIKDAIISYKY